MGLRFWVYSIPKREFCFGKLYLKGAEIPRGPQLAPKRTPRLMDDQYIFWPFPQLGLKGQQTNLQKDSMGCLKAQMMIESQSIACLSQERKLDQVIDMNAVIQKPDSSQTSACEILSADTKERTQLTIFQGILSDWLRVQKRMVNALTPRPLSDSEIGGNFHGNEHVPDATSQENSDISDFIDANMISKCHLQLDELDKTVRYDAVWRIVLNGDCNLSAEMKRVDMLGI